jgi:two-component system cell cycle response regulator DivK
MAAPAVLPGPLLVVEDDEATAALYAEILGPLAVVVGAPEEALRLAGQNRYAVAIIDINLGLAGINGRQLQQRLRQVPTMAETKFVAVTAFAMKGDEEKLIADGFDAYLAKPFTADELASVLARQVNPPRVDQ